MVTALDGSVVTLQGEMTAAQGSITALDTRVVANRNDIGTVENSLKNVKQDFKGEEYFPRFNSPDSSISFEQSNTNDPRVFLCSGERGWC